jgi:hypothetical protein
MNNKYFLYFLLFALVCGFVTVLFIPYTVPKKLFLIGGTLFVGVLIALKFKKMKKNEQ